MTEIELLEHVRQQRCVACGRKPSDPHHVTTRGAGGKNTPDNLMPLCRWHHIEWHQGGPSKMIQKYSGVFEWLLAMCRFDIFDRVGISIGED